MIHGLNARRCLSSIYDKLLHACVVRLRKLSLTRYRSVLAVANGRCAGRRHFCLFVFRVGLTNPDSSNC